MTIYVLKSQDERWNSIDGFREIPKWRIRNKWTAFERFGWKWSSQIELCQAKINWYVSEKFGKDQPLGSRTNLCI